MTPVKTAILQFMNRVRPDSPSWAWRLGIWHLKRVLRHQAPDHVYEAGLARTLLERALGQWEKRWAQQQVSDELPALITGVGNLRWIAEASLEAGDLERAAEAADSVLALVAQLKAQVRARRVYDGSVEMHGANIILGKVSLATGDHESAQKYLLAAAEPSGHEPALDVYGPDFTLANALLQRGYRDSVIRYLESWRTFWILGQELVDSWLRQLREGSTPQLDKAAWVRSRGPSDLIRARIRKGR